MARICDGHGATITFAAVPGFTGKVTNIGALRHYRDVIDDTGLSDDDERKCPGKLKRRDPIEFEWITQDDTDVQALAFGAVGTVTIQMPVGEGQATGPLNSFSGFVSSASDPSLGTSENTTGNGTVEIDGAVTFTPGA